VSLLASINPEADTAKLHEAVRITLDTFAEIKSKNLTGDAAQELIQKRVGPALMSVSKCPDFIMDRGHDYPWFRQMTDEDKDAVIELLKTF
jgi:hypothetical protein